MSNYPCRRRRISTTTKNAHTHEQIKTINHLMEMEIKNSEPVSERTEEGEEEKKTETSTAFALYKNT